MNPNDSPPPTPKFRPRDAKTILVDASGYIFRAYYGLPALSNSDDRPTQATFGFLKMLGRLVQSVSAERLVLAFDTAAPTFRKETYSQYKANRPPPPEDLIPQFEDIHKLVDLLGIASVTLPGYEADDILATLARQAKQDGQTPVLIISSDKDLLQLVEPEIQVWDTLKNIIYNEDEVRNKMGIFPERIPDYLGLVGDSSDNIPGVAGIGRKSAITLIQSFGDIEAIFRHANEAPPRCIKKLKAEGAIDQALLSRKLARVCKEAPVPHNLNDLWGEPRDDENLSNLLNYLNIPPSLGRFPNSTPLRPEKAPAEAVEDCQTHPLENEDSGYESFAHSIAPKIRIDSAALPQCMEVLIAEIQGVEKAIGGHQNSLETQAYDLEALALILDMLRETKKEIPEAYEDDFGQVVEEIWLTRAKSARELHVQFFGGLSAAVIASLANLLKAKPQFEYLGLRFKGIEEAVLAKLSGDPTLTFALQEGLGPYEEMANSFFSLLPGMATDSQIRQLRAIHEGVIIAAKPKQTSSILGWSPKKTREAFAQYRESFPEIANFVDESRRAFESEEILQIIGGRKVPWSSETANRQFLGLSLSESPAFPALARIRESCYQLCKKASDRAHSILRNKLDEEFIGYQGTTTLAFEVPKAELESLQDLLIHDLQNTIELDIPLVIHPSRGDNLISI